MPTEFTEDFIRLSDLKINPSKVVSHAKDSHRPILLTSRGRGIAVMQDLEYFEGIQEELKFIQAIAKGLIAIQKGDTLKIEEVKKQFEF